MCIRDRDQPLVPYRAVGDKLKPTIMLQKALREHGISTVVRYSTIIIAPPLTISGSELREGMMGIDGALKLLAESK